MACTLLFSGDQGNALVRRIGMLARDRILVVDDNESARSILAEALEYEGFRVTTAADGRHAWDLVQHMPFAYDLVLTDMRMPAMDGIELLSKIMTDLPWIKVIVMTGAADPDLRVKAELLGAFTVLSKPFGVEQVYQSLRRALAN
jgi:two-component system cell cycle response regulator CpdR